MGSNGFILSNDTTPICYIHIFKIKKQTKYFENFCENPTANDPSSFYQFLRDI